MAARVLACVLLGLCCRRAAAFHANVAARVPLLRCGHAALSRSSGKLQRGCHGRARVAMQADSEGGGFFGGFFSNIFGGAVEMSPDKARVVGAITSPSGWSCKSRADLSLEIGSAIAKQLGGTGELARGDVMTVNLGVAIRMSEDVAYDPPQGSVLIVSDSEIFQGEGFWSVAEDTELGVPTAIQANLKCPKGLTVSGKLVVPPGNLYVNMKVRDEPPTGDAPVRGLNGVSMYDGRLTIKEDVKSSFILTPYNGILAEFKIVGACKARPRPRTPA